MTDTVDHTAAIFAALGITPETQPEFWDTTDYGFRDGKLWIVSDMYMLLDKDRPLEADGLAVRLVFLLSQREKVDIYLCPSKDMKWCVNFGNDKDPDWTFYNSNLAHAVHDALCEALGIGQ